MPNELIEQVKKTDCNYKRRFPLVGCGAPDNNRDTLISKAVANFVKTNAAIRCAPAVEAGVINSAWTVADLVAIIEA
jgi:hypothetical protein